MIRLKNLQLGLLASLVACSSSPEKTLHITHAENPAVYRSVAASGSIKATKRSLAEMTDRLYYSYLLGQKHLEEFDKLLDKDPSTAMKSQSYSSLLAIRSYVDEIEDRISDLQVGYNIIASEIKVSDEDKLIAETAIKQIDNFIKGVRGDSSLVPENLRPLILSNLRLNQANVYESIVSIFENYSNRYSEDSSLKVKAKFAGLKSHNIYIDNLNTYKVDSKVFRKAFQSERSKKMFRELEANINDQSKLMKEYISEIGRDTSSDTIAPSTGPNGNISGKNFPKNTWSITFDDGPGKTTDQLITNLVERKIPATFFMLAKQATILPNTVARLKAEGFDLASHSYTHAQLTKVNAVKLEREIGTSKKTLEAATGTKIKLFRLPYGAGVSVSKVRAKIAEHKMIHVFWTVDTLDWQDKNPSSILARTLKQMNASDKNAGVILFHDIHPQSVKASTMLMDHLNSKNDIVCTVQGVVDQMNNNLPSCR